MQSLKGSPSWEVAGLSNSSGGGYKAPHSEREDADATSNQTQPYQTSASAMVGVLASELVLLLANRVQLGGPILPKETGVQG